MGKVVTSGTVEFVASVVLEELSVVEFVTSSDTVDDEGDVCGSVSDGFVVVVGAAGVVVAALEEVVVGASVVVLGTSVVVVTEGVDDDVDKASVVKKNTKAMIPANIRV